jgi:hypothetical protein
MADMSPRMTAQWAKEEILDAIDAFVKEKLEEKVPGLSWDEEQALKLERDRIAIRYGKNPWIKRSKQ